MSKYMFPMSSEFIDVIRNALSLPEGVQRIIIDADTSRGESFIIVYAQYGLLENEREILNVDWDKIFTTPATKVE